MQGYDVIGDVHGQAGKLKRLLRKLGYVDGNGSWHNVDGRKAIFTGDIIDRGPNQIETVELVRAMIDAKDAFCVMGNHEFNAIQFAAGYRSLRRGGDPHEKFLREIPQGSSFYDSCLSWFQTLPLWLEFEHFFVVHACYQEHALKLLATSGFAGGVVPRELFPVLVRGKTFTEDNPQYPIYRAIKTLMCGWVIDLPKGVHIFDKDGIKRFDVRVKWWLDSAKTYRDVAITNNPPGIPDIPLPTTFVSCKEQKAVLFGHYWLPHLELSPLANKRICVDFSAGKKGPLVCYRMFQDVEKQPHFMYSY